MKKILSIAVVLLMEIAGVTVRAQQVARIAGEGSYLNIREKPSSDSKIIGTFKAGELFYVLAEEDSWRKATSIYSKEGYVFSPRIELIDSLPDAQLQNLFNHIFENEKVYADNFSLAFSKYNSVKKKFNSRTDSLNDAKARRQLENYYDGKFSPLVEMYADYFCRTADTVTLQNLFAAIWANNGSANESPAWCLGKCFVCNSALMKKQIAQLTIAQQKYIESQTEYGLYNVYDVDVDSTDSNAEFNALLLLLNE